MSNYPQNPIVTFSTKLGDHEITGEVINPGEEFGNVCIIEIGCGFSSFFFAIECEDEQTAIDILADSRFSHHIEIEEDEENDEDYCSYAGNEGIPVNLDNVAIHSTSETRYFSPFLLSSGVTSVEYSELESSGKLENVWGDELRIEPSNPSRYVDLLFPLKLPNVKEFGGYASKTVICGDLVEYTRKGMEGAKNLGRALGILTVDGSGGDSSGVVLVVMEISGLSNCYLRTVAIEDVVNVAPVSKLTRWFFGQELPDSQTLLTYARHGSLNSRYIGNYTDREGQLKRIDRPFHYKDIEANRTS